MPSPPGKPSNATTLRLIAQRPLVDSRAAATHRNESDNGEAVPEDTRLNAMLDLLRAGQPIVDWAFDAIYPDWLSLLSPRHWTPLDVARRAAKMLVLDPGTRVLDVGSGVGKFCLIGAISTPATFTGIEQRGHLVDVAKAVAARYGVTRASYLHGDMRDIDWTQFDAFYFFNSFGENRLEVDHRIDNSVELSQERFERDVPVVLSRLERARIGTRVVTYYGLGASLPTNYELCAAELAGTDVLELWVKVRS